MAASDTLFAEVVRASAAASASPIRVDPRPLRTGMDAKGGEWLGGRADANDLALDSAGVAELVPLDMIKPDSASLANVPDEMVRQRSRVLSRMGLVETDAMEDSRCPGIMLPPGRKRDLTACPVAGQFTSVMLSMPRPGGAYWPGVVDEREEGRRQGHWTIRVVERSMEPRGSSTVVVDYVVEPKLDRHGWVVVKRVPLFVIE